VFAIVKCLDAKSRMPWLAFRAHKIMSTSRKSIGFNFDRKDLVKLVANSRLPLTYARDAKKDMSRIGSKPTKRSCKAVIAGKKKREKRMYRTERHSMTFIGGDLIGMANYSLIFAHTHKSAVSFGKPAKCRNYLRAKFKLQLSVQEMCAWVFSKIA
jgi:hypothetical protein